MSTTSINSSTSSGKFDFWKIIRLVIGTSFIVISLQQAVNFPTFSTLLLTLLSIIFGAQLVNKHAWLVALPICLIAVDLSAFSGRFIFNELDFFVLIIIGTALITHQYQHRFPITIFTLLPFALVLLAFSTANFDAIWLELNQPLTQNPYYSSLYQFKVAKGFLYGLAFALLFYNQYKTNNTLLIKHLVIGGWFGSLLMFLIVLWERHTLVPLFNLQPWWAIAASLLDLTSSYRVTGLFSDMHTGGEAIDGIYLLLVPLNFFGFYWFERNSFRIISLIALFMVSYCIMVGFTRATYFSMAISLFSFALLFQLWLNKDKPLSFTKLFGYLLLIILSYISFTYAGYTGLASFCAISATGFLGKCLQNKRQLSTKTYLLAYSLMSILFSLLAINNHFHSRWITASSMGLFILIISLILISAIIYFINHNKTASSLSHALLNTASISIVAVILAIALGGTQINTRMTTISQDVQTRLNHWQSILASSDNSFTSTIFGNGVGSMPLNYVLTHPDTVEKVGSFTIKNEQLSLGTGDDLAFGQRVNIKANSTYHINLNGYSDNNGQLTAFLCERNMIFASDFIANCAAKTTTLDSNVSANFSIALNSGNVGQKTNPLMRWPTLLYLKNTSRSATVNLNNISLTVEGSTENLLSNSDFSQGLDHWFFYNDFQHLPWHIKNIYLSIFYQLGLLGVLAFLLLLIPMVKVNRADIVQTALQILIISYLLGVFAFGLFGDPLDSARASIYFFMLLFSIQFINTKSPTR